MNIRPADPLDAPAISDLLVRLSNKFIAPALNEEGRSNLLGSMSPAAIEGFFNEGYRYHVAVVAGEGATGRVIVGVAGTRDNVHLFHLFVDERFQGQGLSSKLWQVARDACLADTSDGNTNPGYFSVNASLNAQGIYRQWGFTPIAGIRQGGGVFDVPMRMPWPLPSLALLPPEVRGSAMHPLYMPASGRDEDYFRSLSRACYEALVAQQFGAWDDALQNVNFNQKWQEQQFRKVFIGADLVGGVWVETHPEYLQIREIQIHPQFQNRGIGHAVLEDVIRESEFAGLLLRLRVLHQNKAIALYERFGFSITERTDTQYIMTR